MRSSVIFIFLGLLSLASCGESTSEEPNTMIPENWQGILESARGKEITMMMWQGDPLINLYMQNYVKKRLKDSFGIELNVANGQGSAIVQSLMAERQAAKEVSTIDLVWINGETFYQLRQLEALYGPFLDRLPNAQYLDLSNPFIGQDFQQDIRGMECPWGNVQMAWIYDRENVNDPPQSRKDLYQFVQRHPGTFTFDSHFTGMTFLKALLLDIAGDPNKLYGDFDDEKYLRYSQRLWQYLDSLRPFLWKEGQTFPSSVAPMHQMFANDELWFTFSNNDAEVDNKIIRGIFDTSARAYVPEIGSIQNSHYLGIPNLSGNKAAAMVAINFLISPQAQYKKSQPDVWGDGTVLNISSLPEEWRGKFQEIPGRKYAPDRDEIEKRAYRELAPEYMVRLYDDFQQYISGMLER